MDEDSNVVRLRQPEEIDDPLTTIRRTGVRRLLEQAIDAEVDTFLVAMKDVKLPDGRDRVVRHRHGPERTIQAGIGPAEVRRATQAEKELLVDAAFRQGNRVNQEVARRKNSESIAFLISGVGGVDGNVGRFGRSGSISQAFSGSSRRTASCQGGVSP